MAAVDPDELPSGSYTWEAEYERPWEAIQEDIEGHMVAPDDRLDYKTKRRKLFHHDSRIKLGMMRHLVVILDSTHSMSDKDLKPDRLTCSKTVLEKFLEEFFDRNPISQIGLAVIRDGKSHRLTELSGNIRTHKVALEQVTKKHPPSGECSLQNAMELALKLLRHIPSHASREVVIVHGSLTSCDPSNIFGTIEEFVTQSIRCSIIGLAAHVRLCHTICQRTSGSYQVITDEIHFKDLLLQHCRAPQAKASSDSTLIKMGFPQHCSEGNPSICLCHLDSKQKDYLSVSGYYCPQCASKYCELPVECVTCGMTLVMAPHLARTYHHIFPLEMFEEKPISQVSISHCYSCRALLASEVYVCPSCHQGYCIDCDLYCHETLHNCPGCQAGNN